MPKTPKADPGMSLPEILFARTKALRLLHSQIEIYAADPLHLNHDSAEFKDVESQREDLLKDIERIKDVMRMQKVIETEENRKAIRAQREADLKQCKCGAGEICMYCHIWRKR